ncbi:MAG: glucokinase [Desulfovibrionaceae bacterium]|nr:glucokinase [Desulfovibrionaceae bacterium]
MYCLAFDIGGTNCRVAVYSVESNGDAVLMTKDVVPTASLKNAKDLAEYAHISLKQYLLSCRACAIACAAPVINGRAELTNAGLVLEKGELQDLLGMQVALLNDYAAVCYACQESSAETAEKIWGKVSGSASSESQPGTRAVFGAGTGLGCAAVMGNGNKAGMLLSEGGHMSCPFEGEDERSFEDFLREQGIDQPSYEDVLSGRGLKKLVLHKTGQALSGKECGRKFLQHNPDGNMAGRLYARFLGRFARNWALCTASWGGLWIAGGIAVENRELVSSVSFRNEFVSGRHRDLMEKMPVYLFRDGDCGLRGAMICAVRLAQEQIQAQEQMAD